MTTEVKLPSKRPYVAPVLERIELSVDTKSGGHVAFDGAKSVDPFKDAS
jgi:hypothetical protein